MEAIFPTSIEATFDSVEEEGSVIIYEVRSGDDYGSIRSMIEEDHFYLFIASRSFDVHFLELSSEFFFVFSHYDDPSEEIVIRFNTLMKYKSILDELRNKSEELENTVFELAFASTNVLEQNEFLEKMAKKDGLTMLYNHSYFKDKMKHEFDRSGRYDNNFTLAILDLDFFKKVNDTHGHLKGDEVLKAFANVISDMVRESDIAARYGGEEFAIIFTETGIKEAVIAIDRIRKEMDKKVFESPIGKFSVTFSAGITLFDEKFKDIEEMIHIADKALYMSKRNGRNMTTVL
ncbi:GGDEF domain-containing protein [Limisalsivibrio acetivorans]|uniref:GGDEF domain-containing protein n=1 Tax=Limisalsivibrio acetivorans TaxID=1304888 RepID=UPI0003B2E76A|nr:GGDEF domain-containing protein [Limisalsivibrio acetivorans]